jgi:uncharacterized membrane protein YgdD (TMEM256/DUF423 family)
MAYLIALGKLSVICLEHVSILPSVKLILNYVVYSLIIGCCLFAGDLDYQILEWESKAYHSDSGMVI